jgi:hypothetical protein
MEKTDFRNHVRLSLHWLWDSLDYCDHGIAKLSHLTGSHRMTMGILRACHMTMRKTSSGHVTLIRQHCYKLTCRTVRYVQMHCIIYIQ